MISKKDLALALRNKAKEIADANSYTLVTAGQEFTPDVNQLYITEAPLYGNDNLVGLEDNSNDSQFGLYQLTVLSPRTLTKWAALDIVDILQIGFARGVEMTVNNQTVRAMNTSITELDYNPTHLMYAVRVAYSVIN